MSWTGTVSIPIFYRNKQKEAIHEAERSRDSRQADLNFELKQQYLAAQASDQLMCLYLQQLRAGPLDSSRFGKPVPPVVHARPHPEARSGTAPPRLL